MSFYEPERLARTIEFMSTAKATSILDLTDSKTMYELAIEAEELLGRKGNKLLTDLRERASEADYTHLYFRDPLRPGVVWFSTLLNEKTVPTRAKLDEARIITEKVFPNFLASIDQDDDDSVLKGTPPLTTNASGLDLVTALEYIVFLHPGMVRAWAALIFTYGEILKIKEAAENTYAECIGTCPHSQVVQFLLHGSAENHS